MLGLGSPTTDYARVARVADEADFDEFDFIVVGGGTAGCVLAARLSERADLRVLLIEAGSSGKVLWQSRTPAAFTRLVGGPHDYAFHTEPQRHAANRKMLCPRARLLGGCSSINALMAHYGAPSDYDEWASIVADNSWAWRNFETYFRKFENYIPNPRYPHVDISLKGSGGPIVVRHTDYTWPGVPRFIDASINAGIPFSPDFTTSKGTIGTNKIMCYIDRRHQRVSAETAYLTPEVLARPNLKVVTLARVTKIIFDSSSGTPRAVAVEFANSKQRATHFRARARKEVIICGTIHSPQLLMLSGVGPASLLREHGISVLVDSPGVGANLRDHLQFACRFGDKLHVSINYARPYDLTTAFKVLKALTQYQLFSTGPFTSNAGDAASFFRADNQKMFPPAEYKNVIEDSTSGPDAPDLEAILVASPVDGHGPLVKPGLWAYSILIILLRPTSIGSLQIRSADPWDAPIIDPNYLTTQHDVDTLVRGARGAYTIAHTAPLSDMTDTGNADPDLDHNFGRLSDAELAEIVRGRVETLYHPVGTCRMGKEDDPGAVVDAQLKVRGARGLRVCDASVFPNVPAGHTAGPTLATAEKLADMIKAEYPVQL